jgi:hypothetical protein
MNKADLSNLRFLLKADETTLREWYNNAVEDDILYAIELLNEVSLDLIDEAVGLSHCTEANAYLSKFRI